MTDFRIYCLAHSMNDKPNGCELRDSCSSHTAIAKEPYAYRLHMVSIRNCDHEFNNHIKDETK
jgi:hypothetical protein